MWYPSGGIKDLSNASSPQALRGGEGGVVGVMSPQRNVKILLGNVPTLQNEFLTITLLFKNFKIKKQ